MLRGQKLPAMATQQEVLSRYGHILPICALSSATYVILLGEKRPTVDASPSSANVQRAKTARLGNVSKTDPLLWALFAHFRAVQTIYVSALGKICPNLLLMYFGAVFLGFCAFSPSGKLLNGSKLTDNGYEPVRWRDFRLVSAGVRSKSWLYTVGEKPDRFHKGERGNR